MGYPAPAWSVFSSMYGQMPAGQGMNYGVPEPVNPMIPPNMSAPMQIAPSVTGGIQPSVAPNSLTGLNPEQLAYAKAQNAAMPNQQYGQANAWINGIGAVGNIGLGAIALWQAQNQFNFQKEFAEKNYANSLKSYNQNLENKIKNRASYMGKSAAEGEAEYQSKKLNGKD